MHVIVCERHGYKSKKFCISDWFGRVKQLCQWWIEYRIRAKISIHGLRLTICCEIYVKFSLKKWSSQNDITSGMKGRFKGYTWKRTVMQMISGTLNWLVQIRCGKTAAAFFVCGGLPHHTWTSIKPILKYLAWDFLYFDNFFVLLFF